jgi:hypothetical protein
VKGEINLKVTLKNYEIIEAVECIKNLLKKKGFSTRCNFILNKNLIKLEPSYKTYVNSELALVNKYATKKSDGTFEQDESGQPKFTTANFANYVKERNELIEYEDSVDIQKVNISEFPSDIGEGINLHGIMFMIDDDIE